MICKREDSLWKGSCQSSWLITVIMQNGSICTLYSLECWCFYYSGSKSANDDAVMERAPIWAFKVFTVSLNSTLGKFTLYIFGIDIWQKCPVHTALHRSDPYNQQQLLFLTGKQSVRVDYTVRVPEDCCRNMIINYYNSNCSCSIYQPPYRPIYDHV